MKLILALFLTAGALLAQQTNYYEASAATTALTIQAPAFGATNPIVLKYATVYCASASTITPMWGAAAATATAGTIKKQLGTFQAATATMWTASNASGGTTGTVYNVPAGGTFNFTFDDLKLPGGNTASNYTLTTSNSCTITIQWVEQF